MLDDLNGGSNAHKQIIKDDNRSDPEPDLQIEQHKIARSESNELTHRIDLSKKPQDEQTDRGI